MLLGFLHLPKNKANYSHMEVINIIMVICMIHKWIDEYLYKSIMKSRDYNKNGDMDVDVDDEGGDGGDDEEDA